MTSPADIETPLLSADTAQSAENTLVLGREIATVTVAGISFQLSFNDANLAISRVAKAAAQRTQSCCSMGQDSGWSALRSSQRL